MYLFDLNPGPIFTYASWCIIFFLVVLGASILLLIYTRSQHLDKAHKKCLVPSVTHLFWFSITGMLLVIFRLNGIPILSMRLFLVLWAVAFVAYLVGRQKACSLVMAAASKKK